MMEYTFVCFLVCLASVRNVLAEMRFLTQDQDNTTSIINRLRDEVASLTAAYLVTNKTIQELTNELKTVTEELTETKSEFRSLADNTNLLNGQETGSTYVRWGKSTCSGGTSSLVYSGYAGGSDWNTYGAAVNYVCLVKDPFLVGNSSFNKGAQMHGATFVMDNGNWIETSQRLFGKDVTFQGAPCAVCHIPRSSVLMVPGKNTCHSGWKEEYRGYLTAGYQGHKAGSEFVCLDENPEGIAIGNTLANGKLFYLTEAVCGGSLQCPPYENGKELTCAVCSK